MMFDPMEARKSLFRPLRTNEVCTVHWFELGCRVQHGRPAEKTRVRAPRPLQNRKSPKPGARKTELELLVPIVPSRPFRPLEPGEICSVHWFERSCAVQHERSPEEAREERLLVHQIGRAHV